MQMLGSSGLPLVWTAPDAEASFLSLPFLQELSRWHRAAVAEETACVAGLHDIGAFCLDSPWQTNPTKATAARIRRVVEVERWCEVNYFTLAHSNSNGDLNCNSNSPSRPVSPVAPIRVVSSRNSSAAGGSTHTKAASPGEASHHAVPSTPARWSSPRLLFWFGLARAVGISPRLWFKHDLLPNLTTIPTAAEVHPEHVIINNNGDNTNRNSDPPPPHNFSNYCFNNNNNSNPTSPPNKEIPQAEEKTEHEDGVQAVGLEDLLLGRRRVVFGATAEAGFRLQADAALRATALLEWFTDAFTFAESQGWTTTQRRCFLLDAVALLHRLARLPETSTDAAAREAIATELIRVLTAQAGAGEVVTVLVPPSPPPPPTPAASSTTWTAATTGAGVSFSSPAEVQRGGGREGIPNSTPPQTSTPSPERSPTAAFTEEKEVGQVLVCAEASGGSKSLTPGRSRREVRLEPMFTPEAAAQVTDFLLRAIFPHWRLLHAVLNGPHAEAGSVATDGSVKNHFSIQVAIEDVPPFAVPPLTSFRPDGVGERVGGEALLEDAVAPAIRPLATSQREDATSDSAGGVPPDLAPTVPELQRTPEAKAEDEKEEKEKDFSMSLPPLTPQESQRVLRAFTLRVRRAMGKPPDEEEEEEAPKGTQQEKAKEAEAAAGAALEARPKSSGRKSTAAGLRSTAASPTPASLSRGAACSLFDPSSAAAGDGDAGAFRLPAVEARVRRIESSVEEYLLQAHAPRSRQGARRK